MGRQTPWQVERKHAARGGPSPCWWRRCPAVSACGGGGDDDTTSSAAPAASPPGHRGRREQRRRAATDAAATEEAAPSTEAAEHSEPASTFTGEAVKISLWVPWSDRELSVFEQVVGEYDAAHPEVEVELVGGVNDDKILQSMRAGNAGDVVASFDSANVGKFCESGGWVDLSAASGHGRDRPQHLPGHHALLHVLRRQAVRAADPGRRLRAVLQQRRCSPRPASAGRRRPWTSSWTTPRS